MRPNNYTLLQFPKETNTRGSKTLTFYSFSHKFTVLINKAYFSHNYLKNIMLRPQNNINMLGELKTDAFER